MVFVDKCFILMPPISKDHRAPGASSTGHSPLCCPWNSQIALTRAPTSHAVRKALRPLSAPSAPLGRPIILHVCSLFTQRFAALLEKNGDRLHYELTWMTITILESLEHCRDFCSSPLLTLSLKPPTPPHDPILPTSMKLAHRWN